MYHVAFEIEIVPQAAGHGDGSLRSIVPVEEILFVAARYDACALVVQQWRRVPLEDADVVAQAFQDHAGEEAAEGATDLLDGLRQTMSGTSFFRSISGSAGRARMCEFTLPLNGRPTPTEGIARKGNLCDYNNGVMNAHSPQQRSVVSSPYECSAVSK